MDSLLAMKRLAIPLTIFPLLLACNLTAPTPAATSTALGAGTPRASPAIPATTTAVITNARATATARATSTAIPTLTALHTPTPSHPLSTSTPTSPSQPGPLPQVVAAITLGDAPQACVGNALAVDSATGYLHTAGLRDGQPCLTVIDPATSQVLETRTLPFEPQHLLWDGETLYAIGQIYDFGQDSSELVIADAGTGEMVAREITVGHLHNGRAVVRDGWAYLGVPGDLSFGVSGALYLIPLRGGTPLTIADAHAFDLADDGRIAVVGGSVTTTVRVYAGTGGDLLAEQEIGPGQPGESLAFDGQTNRIFVSRQQAAEEISETRYFVGVLDATSLEPVNSVEEQVWRLTADPSRGRIYGYAPGGQIVGFDASTGEPLGTIFTVPQGEPAGFTAVSPWKKLHVDPATGRVHVVYTDFDTGTWAAVFDPATGTGVGDVQVPSGAPWVLDTARGQLTFAGHAFLLSLDAVTLEPVWRMVLSREPVSAAIAPDPGYLFVGDAGGDVHVLDLQTHAEVRLLPGVGGHVDVDPAHGWLYAGDEFVPGISVYNLTTLEPRGLIPQPGRPTASPADGLVYILEEDVYSGDGATLEVIEGRTVRNSGCNGCTQATGVAVDPRNGQTHVTTYYTWVGKPGPTSHAALDPATGHAFVARTTGGYRVVYTLAAYSDLTLERELGWRDGIYGQPLYNPVTGQLYLANGSRLLVLDGESLDLVGWLHPGDEDLIPAAVDAGSGRLYLLAGQQVLVLEGSGGRLETLPPQPVASLPGPPEGIVPLPDGTLFVRAYDRANYVSRLYRSTDSGGAWQQVRGGLPGAPNDLASAPDGTLYAALTNTDWRAETEEASWGEGVYRSTGGGDTWTPLSRGLAHLRAGRLHAGDDGTLYALATGTWPELQGQPVPTIWQLGEDDRWSQVKFPEAGPFIGPDGTVYAHSQAIRAAWHTLTGSDTLYRSWGGELHRSADGGLTWETIGPGPADYGTQVLTGAGDPPSLYWLTWDALYRSTDGGTSWAQLSHPALAGSGPSAIAVAEWDGEETLFVGTEAGELLVLPAAEAGWETE